VSLNKTPLPRFHIYPSSKTKEYPKEMSQSFSAMHHVLIHMSKAAIREWRCPFLPLRQHSQTQKPLSEPTVTSIP